MKINNNKKKSILIFMIAILCLILLLIGKRKDRISTVAETGSGKKDYLNGMEYEQQRLEQEAMLCQRQPYNMIYGKWEVVRSTHQGIKKYDYAKGDSSLKKATNETADMIGVVVTITPDYIMYEKDGEIICLEQDNYEHRVDVRLDFVELFYYRTNREANFIKWVKEDLESKPYFSITWGKCGDDIDKMPNIVVDGFIVVDDETLIADAIKCESTVKLKRLEHMRDSAYYYQYPGMIYNEETIQSKAKLGKVNYIEEDTTMLDKRDGGYVYLPTYGEWEVNKILAKSNNACISKKEISKLIGTHIKMDRNWMMTNGQIVAKYYKTKIDIIPILSRTQTHMKGHPELSKLGITGDYFVFIEVISAEGELFYREPLRKFYIKDEDTIIVEEQGYYLELKRISQPDNLNYFYEFA